jgi:hypothetical protein
MTPVTGATFPTAMRQSAPCLEAERQRRASILLSRDAGRARLASTVPLRFRRSESGSVLGWRAPEHRLTAVGLGPRGPGRRSKGVSRQPPASSPASEAYNRRSRGLIRSGGGHPLDRPPAPSPASEADNRRSRALIRLAAGRLLGRSIATKRRKS